jgi:hypothetical protein
MDAMSGAVNPQAPEQEAPQSDAAQAEQANLGQQLDPARPERRKRLSREQEQELLSSIKKKFKRWQKFEGTFVEQYKNDVRFVHGDSENKWQWDDAITKDRGDRPTLTVNVTRVHCALVINEMRRSPPSIMIKPTGLGATGDSAKTIGGVVREIQRSSRAVQIYVNGGRSAVYGGVGYWRVITEWAGPRSFVQNIRVRSVQDATKAGLDVSAKEPNGRDANWGFIYEDVPNDEVEELYPEIPEDVVGSQNDVVVADWGDLTWRLDKTTRVCEWYEKEHYQDELVGYYDGGEEKAEFRSKIDKDVLAQLLTMPLTRVRPVTRCRVMWYKVVGDRIVDHKEIPGEYIPIVRVVGEEVVVDGVLDRKGLVRNLKDPQRNLNYWLSSGAEQVALQGKQPYIGPKRAFENNPQWADANTKNYAYLPFNDWDEDNNRPIPAPQRPKQAEMADAYIKGIQIAEQNLRNVSGQHENTEGKEDNAISGRAILARKAQGDVSTYNFGDELANAVEHTGCIILSMMPVVYDTPRMLRITHDDNTEEEVKINPALQAPYAAAQLEGQENTTQVEINPALGTYDVEAKSGPDFATQREWAVEAMSALLAQNKELWTVIGDLAVKNMDFPGADDMAERIKRTINPAVLGEGPTATEQQLQAQIQQMQQVMQSLVDSLAQAQQVNENEDERVTIEAYNAETKRIKELGNAQANWAAAGLDKQWRQVATKTAGEAIDSEDPTVSAEANDKEDEEGKPHPYAQRGEDGGWYLDHPEHGRMRYEPEEGAQ